MPKRTNTNDPWIGSTAAARILECSPWTVVRMWQDGLFKGERLYKQHRFRLSEIHAYKARISVPPRQRKEEVAM
jgi:hypothetical protein